MIEKIAKRYLQSIETTLQHIAGEHLSHTPDFTVMLRYAMGWVDDQDQPYARPTGKRLRPMLLLLCAEAAGGNWQNALPAAAAVEFLHNFSLIHDDIQDNSPTRHNRPSVWNLWGEAQAINAGDSMFALAYVALESLSSNLSGDQTVQVLRMFNQTNLELTRGQHLDMSFETQKDVSVEDYLTMIEGKSAALLSACARMGAFIATDDLIRSEHYAAFGLNLGIAFQIHDDILGIWGDPDVTGKSVATDIVSRKKSLPVLFGLSNSQDLTTIYQKTDFNEQDVDRAVELLNTIGARQYAREQERIYHERAMNALASAQPSGEAAELIEAFVNFLFQRNY